MIIAESFIKQFGKGVPSRKLTTAISPKTDMLKYSCIQIDKGINSYDEIYSIDGNSPSVLNLND